MDNSSLWINEVNDLVGIFPLACSKYYHFIEFRHLEEESIKAEPF